ncbi:MAG: IucA/IucC family protein [Solirubrobacteraceae bacterium]|nr:IucA/IucC family protein [Solirubrobacteraceae bacterium]
MTESERASRGTSAARDAAVAAATETLLNCYLREGGEWQALPAAEAGDRAQPGDTHVALLALRDRRRTLLAGVRYLSPTQRHRFRLPVMLAVDGGQAVPVTLDTLAALLVEQLGGAERAAGGADAIGAGRRDGGRVAPDPAPLLERLHASVAAVASFLTARDGEVDALWSAAPLSFVESEQALLLGHMLHPTPKSRTEMSAAQQRAYSPEAGARFALHWLAVDAGLVEHDSATGTPAPQLAERLLRDDPAVDEAALDAALAGLGERVLIPAHPWELAHLRERDAVAAALLADGAIVDLGPLGGAVAPTSSLRTVHGAGWPYQLKFSLHVRVTNSMRVTLPKELRRAVEAARLLQTEVGAQAARLAPDFVMLQDPAYLAVRHGGELIDGLSVLLRDNRWPAASRADVSALTTLCQDHPYGGRSRIGQLVATIARREQRSEPQVARAWFQRYGEVVLVPLLRLFGELGLCMEPHQQNVLLELEAGWPARAVYRDSQGYFHREAAHDDITAIVPGIGEDSESIFPEALADERLVYYPFVNNALGVINALGVAGCLDEHLLLADLRALLERERARGARYPATLLDRLLDDPTWPCKANLRTRLHDMDELIGDIADQSVYVTIANPLREGAA